MPDDELRRFEKRFGARVQLMGAWNSDGVYGYITIPIAAVQRAAEALKETSISSASAHLCRCPESARTELLWELIDRHGSSLIEKIIDFHRESLPAAGLEFQQRAVSFTG